MKLRAGVTHQGFHVGSKTRFGHGPVSRPPSEGRSRLTGLSLRLRPRLACACPAAHSPGQTPDLPGGVSPGGGADTFGCLRYIVQQASWSERTRRPPSVSCAPWSRACGPNRFWEIRSPGRRAGELGWRAGTRKPRRAGPSPVGQWNRGAGDLGQCSPALGSADEEE